MGRGVKKCRSLKMCWNLNEYQFKTKRYRSTYMKPMVTTNQKQTLDTQKLEKTEEYH